MSLLAQTVQLSTDLIAKCLSNVKATIRRTDAHIDTCTNGIEKRPKSAKNPEKPNKKILMKNKVKSLQNAKTKFMVKKI